MVAIITGDLTRYTPAMRSITQLAVPANTCEYWQSGSNVADNINTTLEATLAHEMFEWVWLMGDDHTFPENVLLSLLDRDVDVVVPLCLNRFPPFDPTIVKKGGLTRLENLPTGGLYELQDGETCGDAGMLIRRRVLEAIERPWYDRLRSGSLGVDDQCFVDRVKRAGFKVHVDIDNRLGHMSPFTMLPVLDAAGKWHVRFICGSKHVVDVHPDRLKPCQ